MTPEKEIIVLKKNETIPKFEELLDHGNGCGYLFCHNDAGKTHFEGTNPEKKMLTKTEGEAVTTENTAIKCFTTGKIKVNKKETEPHKITDHNTEKRLPCTDKEGKEDETGGKITQIHQ